MWRNVLKIRIRSLYTLPTHAYGIGKTEDILPLSKYGGQHMITALPGAGIGPELLRCLSDVLKYMGTPVYFEEICDSDYEELVRQSMFSIKRNRVAIKSNIAKPTEEIGMAYLNAMVRRKLDLYVNVIHCKSFPPVAKKQKVDIIIVRQNIGGEYAMLEHESRPDVATSYKIILRQNIEKVARFAFEYALAHHRKSVTTVHRADKLLQTDGLFLGTIEKVALEFPEIKHNDLYVGHCCARIMAKPEMFDIILTMNLFGVAIANVICALTGEAGTVSAKNYSDKYAVFEPALKMAFKEITDENVVNPVAMLHAGVDMLHYLQLRDHADALNNAIRRTLFEDRVWTADLGGTNTTQDVVDNVKRHLSNFGPAS